MTRPSRGVRPMLVSTLLPSDGADAGAAAQMTDDQARPLRAAPQALQQSFGDVLVGQAVEAVAAQAQPLGEVGGQGVMPGHIGQGVMERRVEDGHGGRVGQQAQAGLDHGDFRGVVQRVQVFERAQVVQRVRRDAGRLQKLRPAVDDAVAEGVNAECGRHFSMASCAACDDALAAGVVQCCPRPRRPRRASQTACI